MRNLTFLIIGVILANPVFANDIDYKPFGLDQNLSIEQLKKLTKMKSFKGSDIVFESTTVPNASRLIDKYTFLAVKGIGLCKVIGQTLQYDLNNQFNEYKKDHKFIYESLVSKYGVPSEYDKDAKEWLWDLRKIKKGNIRAIQLRDTGGDFRIVTLTYTFNNMPICEKKAKSMESSAF